MAAVVIQIALILEPEGWRVLVFTHPREFVAFIGFGCQELGLYQKLLLLLALLEVDEFFWGESVVPDFPVEPVDLLLPLIQLLMIHQLPIYYYNLLIPSIHFLILLFPKDLFALF